MSLYIKELYDTDYILGSLDSITKILLTKCEKDKINTFYTTKPFEINGGFSLVSDNEPTTIPIKVEILPFSENNKQGAFNISLVPDYNYFRTITLSGIITIDGNGDINCHIIPIQNYANFFIYDYHYCWSEYLLKRIDEFLLNVDLTTEKEFIDQHY